MNDRFRYKAHLVNVLCFFATIFFLISGVVIAAVGVFFRDEVVILTGAILLFCILIVAYIWD